jgi:hypothetical protein
MEHPHDERYAFGIGSLPRWKYNSIGGELASLCNATTDNLSSLIKLDALHSNLKRFLEDPELSAPRPPPSPRRMAGHFAGVEASPCFCVVLYSSLDYSHEQLTQPEISVFHRPRWNFHGYLC